MVFDVSKVWYWDTQNDNFLQICDVKQTNDIGNEMIYNVFSHKSLKMFYLITNVKVIWGLFEDK